MGAGANVTAASALAELLRRPRYEVLPLEGIEEDVGASLGKDVIITVGLAQPRPRRHARGERAARA